jgi:hypothetical protein
MHLEFFFSNTAAFMTQEADAYASFYSGEKHIGFSGTPKGII